MARASATRSGFSTSMPWRGSAPCRRWSNGTRTSRRSPCCWTKRRRPSDDWPRAERTMSSLSELQAGFRAALLADDERRMMADILPDRLGVPARLAVYRHHVLATLTTTLESTFPVVCRLVDG